MNDQTLKDFIARTAKSKVAVIIPLYGYWSDDVDSPLTLETLKLTMDRVQSTVHSMYVFFVGEPTRIPKDVQNYIATYATAGNSSGVPVGANAPYAEYVRKGLEVARETTDSAYFVVLSPWNVIQHVGIDILIDRLNFGDDAKIVSGYDLGKVADPNNFDIQAFENYFMNMPKEERALNSNFFGITRYALEMLNPDPNIKTSHFMERDMWQVMYAKGFEVITSQRLPMFVFDVQLQEMENPADVEADKAYFQGKWGFLPTV